MKRSVKQIINSGEITEWLSYLNVKIIRKNINQINGNFKAAEITHQTCFCSGTTRVWPVKFSKS